MLKVGGNVQQVKCSSKHGETNTRCSAFDQNHCRNLMRMAGALRVLGHWLVENRYHLSSLNGPTLPAGVSPRC